MAEWQTADFGDLLPPPVAAAIGTTTAVVGGASAVLGVTSDALDVASAFIASNPVFDFAGALTALIETFKEDYLGTGWYTLLLTEPALEKAIRERNLALAKERERQRLEGLYASQEFTFTRFEDILVRSFDDEGDTNRPQFVGDCAVAVFVVGANTLSNFIDPINTLKDVFSLDARLRRAVDRLKEIFDEIQGIEPPEPPASVPPDWRSDITLRAITRDLYDVIDTELARATAGLKSGADASQAIQLLITAIQLKIQRLEDALIEIDRLIQNLIGLSSATGVSVIYVESASGIDGLKAGLRGATSKPPFTDDSYIAGLAIAAGGPSLLPFRNLFSVFA